MKLQTMAEFLKRIGIKSISEKTAGAATSLCRRFTVLYEDTPDKVLPSQRKLKDLLLAQWKDSPMADVPAEYPPTPQQFLISDPLWYATAYADGPAVPSPVDTELVNMLLQQAKELSGWQPS